MRFLALLLLAPILAVLGWMYLHYARSRPRSPAQRRIDAAALWVATLGAVAICLAAYDTVPLPGIEHATGLRASGAIWRQVFPPLCGYGVFTGVLFVALGARRWWRH